MSEGQAIEPEIVATGVEPTGGRWEILEARLERWSERMNPILIKEARQALRSKQFIGTFMLMLIAGWAWTVFGLALMESDSVQGYFGPAMFIGYYLIMAIPVLVVAPFSAFHSLSSERQDRTYELVAITSLAPRQILTGKLGCVAMQMTVYLSAIVPCLAFTYLLRGLDVLTILMTVVYVCLLSLGLSVLGLALAAMIQQRQRTIGIGLLFAIALFFAMVISSVLIVQLVDAGVPWNEPEVWIGQMVLLTLYANVFALAFLSARSQLMAESQNRSTALRVAVLVAQASLLGWMSDGQLQNREEFVYIYLMFATPGWYYAGLHFTSEPTELSQRVRRDLPQSRLARIFLSAFYPGPGSGYLYITGGMLASVAIAWLTLMIAQNWTFPNLGPTIAPAPRMNGSDLLQTGLIATGYLVFYLGLGKLLVARLRRYREVRVQLRMLLYHLILIVGTGVPWALQMSLPNMPWSYTLMQMSNPVWTIYDLCTRGLPFDRPVLVLVVPAAGLFVWLLNVPSMAAELEQKRIAKPARVAEEDRELELQAAGPPQPTSPWG